MGFEYRRVATKKLRDDASNLEKVMDILDVWFDSGSTWRAVLQSDEYDAGEYPASMYLEGSDQHGRLVSKLNISKLRKQLNSSIS